MKNLNIFGARAVVSHAESVYYMTVSVYTHIWFLVLVVCQKCVYKALDYDDSDNNDDATSARVRTLCIEIIEN